jgi:hypothetical protein
VILLADTRVTNHGFDDGITTPRQSVLQAGTPVLIDDRGVPRTRCASGNPLTPRQRESGGVTYLGDPWPGFEPDALVAIEPGDAVDVFVLVDVETGEPFSRPVGTDGNEDEVIGATTTTTEATTTTSTTTTSTTTSTTTTSTTTTTVPTEPIDISSEGVATASTSASPEDGPEKAIDGNPATSWFSSGENGDPEGAVYTWSIAGIERIDEVRIVGNGRNPSDALNHGFESVTLEILVGETVVYSEAFGLAGTPDPLVTVRPDVDGDTIRLSFAGHESLDRTGFAELTVIARR